MMMLMRSFLLLALAATSSSAFTTRNAFVGRSLAVGGKTSRYVVVVAMPCAVRKKMEQRSGPNENSLSEPFL